MSHLPGVPLLVSDRVVDFRTGPEGTGVWPEVGGAPQS